MAEPSAVVLVENKTVKRESTYKRPIEEKPDTCCGSCCYSCIGCFFGCCLSCFECTCGNEKYVSLSTKLMAASFDSKLTWPKEKVPLPEDGTLDDYSHDATHYFGLDPGLMGHAAMGSALGWKGFGYYIMAKTYEDWPDEPLNNWKSPEHADAVLFSDQKHFKKPAPLPVTVHTAEGLAWLCTHAIGHALLRGVPVPEDIAAADKESGRQGPPREFVECTTEILKDCKLQPYCLPLVGRAVFEITHKGGEVKAEAKAEAGDSKSAAATSNPLVLHELHFNGERFSRKQFDEPAFTDAARGFACGVFTIVNVQFHGVHTHMATADGFVVANMRHLPSTHPMRRLLGMCEMGVHAINEGAMMTLLSAHGSFAHYNFQYEGGITLLLQRSMAAFDAKDEMNVTNWVARQGLLSKSLADQVEEVKRAKHVTVLKDAAEESKEVAESKQVDVDTGHLAEKILASGELSWNPMLEDSVDYWAVFSEHVRSYLALFWKTDKEILEDKAICAWYRALPGLVKGVTMHAELHQCPRPLLEIQDLCTILIYCSTVYHENVGAHTYDLSASPYSLTSQWRQGKTLEEKISPKYITIMRRNGALATTVRSPTIYQDFSYMAPTPEAAAVMKALVGKLTAIEERIKERNKKRYLPFTWLYPGELECSIAV